MYVRPISARFLGGKSTPAILAISTLPSHPPSVQRRPNPDAWRRHDLSLPLLVLGVFANHPNHSAPPNDLAFRTNLFY
jgi:hypothetical protein